MKTTHHYITREEYSPVTLQNKTMYLMQEDDTFLGFTENKSKAIQFDEESVKCCIARHSLRATVENWKLEPVQACPEGKMGSRVTATKVHEGMVYKHHKRSEILKVARDLIETDRQESYGTPAENFATIANLWNDYLLARGIIKVDTETEILPADVAVLNMLQKIARIVTSPDKDENWIDIAGYAGLGAEVANPK